MRPRAPSVLFVLAALAAVRPVGTQIRNLLPITTSGEEHVDAVLSPTGDHVAFRGPDKLAVVAYAGGQEVTLAMGRNLGSFVWAPDASGLYFLDGRDLRFVPRTGGLGRTVATLPELGHALWDVKRDGSELFGTWLYLRDNGGNFERETQVFAIQTDGSAPPRVLVSSLLVVDGVRVSPDQTKIVYREYDAQPFSRHDYFVADIDGRNPVSLTGGAGLGLNPGLPSWLGDNGGICIARIDRLLSRAVVELLMRTDPTPFALTYPTAARNCSVSADGRFIVYEGYWQPGQTWTPVAVPAEGGGHIFFDTSRALAFTGTPMLGGPNGDRLVVSGALGTAPAAQVLKAELGRELLIRPRADLGGTVNLELPVAAGELGVVLLAAAPLPLPVSVGALAGGFQLDPTSVVTVLAGTGTGQGPLQAQLGIPNVPFLSRRAVYLQGVRVTSPMPTGDFTRLVELPLF